MFRKTGYYADNKRVRKALETAHDIRKFEIELYWKRALYFWGFQVAIFAAFAVLFSKNNPDYLLSLMVAALGGIIAICWHYVAEGSKAWQENWEEHIDLLETNIMGNLYKTVLQKADTVFYSVSRINQFVIRIIAGFWLLIIVYIFFTVLCLIWLKYCTIDTKEHIYYWVVFLSSLSLIIGFTIIMWRWGYPWKWVKNKFETDFGTAKDTNIIKLNERSFRKKVKKIN